MEKIWLSCKLYDWTLANQSLIIELEEKMKNLKFECKFSVIPEDTQTVVENLYEKYPNKKV